MNYSLPSNLECHQIGVDLLISDYQDFGVRVLSNFFSNLNKLNSSKRGSDLFSKFKKVPAIICGAGPSLEKQIPLLKELGNKALIFGGGSSLNVLSHFSVPFHFAASFDPDPPPKRFLQQTGFEVPFFYQSRVSSDLLALTHADLLWIPGNGSYPIENKICEDMGLSSSNFDSGWTVGNFMTALAFFMGCDPIIFVGMDFAEKNAIAYASGVESSAPLREGRILAYGANNEPLYTKKDWLMAANWMDDFASCHPATYINATEGGLGFKGIEALTLKDAAYRHLNGSFDLQSKVHAELSLIKKIEVDSSESLKNFSENKGFVYTLCEKILGLIAKYHPAPFQDKAEFILADFELDEEITVTHFLNPLWDVWKKELGDSYIGKILFFMKILKEEG